MVFSKIKWTLGLTQLRVRICKSVLIRADLKQSKHYTQHRICVRVCMGTAIHSCVSNPPTTLYSQPDKGRSWGSRSQTQSLLNFRSQSLDCFQAGSQSLGYEAEAKARLFVEDQMDFFQCSVTGLRH